MYSINGNIIETDKQGYLTDLNQWSRPLGELIAEQEQINMTEAPLSRLCRMDCADCRIWFFRKASTSAGVSSGSRTTVAACRRTMR